MTGDYASKFFPTSLHGSYRLAPLRSHGLRLSIPFEESFEQIDGNRKDDGRVSLHADLGQRLQVAQLQGDGFACDRVGRADQPLGGLVFAFGVDDLGALLAFGFGLARHGPPHLLRQIYSLDLDQRDFDAPLVGVAVQNLLQPHVQLFARGQQFVQLGFAEHGTQRGLGQLRSGVEIVLDFVYGEARLQHAEVDDGVDRDRDVVARNYVLRRHVHRNSSQTDAHHAVNGAKDEDHSRPFGYGQQTPKTKNHAALVFRDNVEHA